MVKALKVIKKEKKHPRKFKRFGSARIMRLKESWRKNVGIDNKVRRKYRGFNIAPRIGYGTKAEHRHVLPNGFKKFIVRHPGELNVLLMQNRTYAAQIAHAVSARKRKLILDKARNLDIKVLNAHARIRTRASE
jgi:large subunit ribosomal protein L32e